MNKTNIKSKISILLFAIFFTIGSTNAQNSKNTKNENQNESNKNFMRNMWDKEYAKSEYIFGTEPDPYFAKVLPQFKPGKILMPGEGEGRNAVYAAKLGWDVTAYDYSKEGKKKADKLAAANNVKINYTVNDILKADFPDESFDALAFLFIHFADKERKEIHKKFNQQLKKNGILIIEVFSTEHPKYNKKSHQEPELLYSKEDILKDFPNYEIIELKVEYDVLKDGDKDFPCSLLRFVGRKK